MAHDDRSKEVITSDSRIVGCRGRVLVAAIVLAILFLALTFTLFYRLFNWTPPPTRSADAPPSAYQGAEIVARVTHPSIDSLSVG